MENAMKEPSKNLADLETSNLVRVCLNETLQSGGSLEECKSTLGVFPSYLLYAICLDPAANLFNEKNIFLLIDNFFKENAIKKIGCEAATQLILLPLKTVQEVACGLILEKQNLTSHLLDNIVLNATNTDCSLSILPKTNELLQNCYPEFEFIHISEVPNENIVSAKIRCMEDLKHVAIGEQIKLCDSFESAIQCTYCEPDAFSRAFLKFLYPNKNFTDEEVKKRILPRYQKLRDRNVANVSKEEVQFEINNTFLGEKIIEYAACENIAEIRVPFFTLTKACSFSPLYPSNETNISSDSFYECEKRIESLTKEEKKIFCEKPSFFFRNMQQDKYFNNSLQVAKTVCDRHLGSDEDEFQKTLELIKAANATNNITNTSIEEISSPDISDGRADLLQMDKPYVSQEGSSGLINKNTAFEKPAIEYGKVTAIAGTILTGIGVVGGGRVLLI